MGAVGAGAAKTEASAEQVAGVAGMSMGAATALMVISLRGLEDAVRNSAGPRSWLGVVIVGAAAVVFLLVPRLRGNPFAVTIAYCFFPIGAMVAIVRALRPEVSTGRWIHAAGLAIATGALIVRALLFAAKKRELDRLLLKESAVAAFYAMVAIGAAYGLAQEFFDAPEVPLTVLAVFGMGVWTIALSLLEWKYK